MRSAPNRSIDPRTVTRHLRLTVARHCGMKVLAISVVTNMAAGILDQPINHAEVLEIGQKIKGQFARLLQALIPRLSVSLN
ncbi:MAG TPA: hypothetical protein VNX88_10045 [Terriglobales bacterium]|nr:hypothetical protein [Terriglobales bacterium]